MKQPDSVAHAIIHELAHYYLYAQPTWYAEGAADFAASYARHIADGIPIEATNSPCAVRLRSSSWNCCCPLMPEMPGRAWTQTYGSAITRWESG